MLIPDTKSYECWDDDNVGEDMAQLHNCRSPEEAVESFGQQFQVDDCRDVWCRDPSTGTVKVYRLMADIERRIEYVAEEK